MESHNCFHNKTFNIQKERFSTVVKDLSYLISHLSNWSLVMNCSRLQWTMHDTKFPSQMSHMNLTGAGPGRAAGRARAGPSRQQRASRAAVGGVVTMVTTGAGSYFFFLFLYFRHLERYRKKLSTKSGDT